MIRKFVVPGVSLRLCESVDCKNTGRTVECRADGTALPPKWRCADCWHERGMSVPGGTEVDKQRS